MGKAVKIILAAAAAFLLLAVLCFAGFMVLADYRNSRYYETATPAGEIEKKYTAPGPCEVSYSEFDASNDAWEKYEVWYPADMGSSGNTYPLVVMANGTGVKASRYKEVFRHLVMMFQK